MAKVLVTGGMGFIGTNLGHELHALGADTIVYDNMTNPTSCSCQACRTRQIVHADIREPEMLMNAMKGVDWVIHLAARGSVVESIVDPMENFKVNVEGTLNVLTAAAKNQVQKVVLASTGGALMGNTPPPVDEHSVPKPISPYGASKLCAEAYAHALAHSWGLNAVVLRFANVYGPHSDRKKGLVTSVIQSLKQEKPVTIYGDGTASRDFIFVEDLCRGIVGACQSPVRDASVFHLSSGQETTVAALVQHLIEISGRPRPKILYHPERTGEVYRNFSTSDAAQLAFGFEVSVSLQEGLERTWDWFQSSRSDAGMAAVPGHHQS